MPIERIVEKFRNEFPQDQEVRSGKYFDMKQLLAAYEAYIPRELNRPNALLENIKFWINVISRLQRQIPANYAQEFCTDLQYVYHPWPIRPNARTLQLEDGGMFFSPFKAGARGLGFGFAIYKKNEGLEN